jgi:hypothetical protein
LTFEKENQTMLALLRNFLIVAILGAGATMLAPEPAQADDGYWKNYWGWYDGNYRPYYNNQYRQYRNYNRDYGYRNDPYNRNRYYDSPYTYGYYGDRNRYDRDRYDRDYRGRRNSVDVNGFRFEWR